MPVAFKCDYGYTTSMSITSISQITWTDTDKLFTIATSDNIVDGTNNNFANQQAIYNKVKEIIGIDVNAICGYPLKPGVSYNYYTPISIFFPSMDINAPNLFSYMSARSANRVIALRFKSIGRIVLLYKSSPSSNLDFKIYNLSFDLLVSSSGGGYSDITLLEMSELSGATRLLFPVIKNYTGGALPNYRYRLDCVMYPNGGGWVNINSGNVVGTTNSLYYYLFYNRVPDIESLPKDPYEEGETSGEGDLPPGTFDDESDPIPLPSLPTVSAANTGFTRIYNPTLSQVQQLATYLWTDGDVLTTIWNHIKQIFEDPMQAMIGFNLVPVPVQDAGSEEFRILYIGTGVYMNVAANQFVDVDCGTVQVQRYYGSALDQSPYTKVSCFLPYIGQVQLDTDEVMGTTLQVVYRVDIVTGSCVAMILVDSNVLYQYSGHCAITIPFASADFSRYVAAAIDIAKIDGAISGGLSISQLANVRPPEGSPSTSSSASYSPIKTKSLGVSNTTSSPPAWNSSNVPLDMSNVNTSTQVSFKGLSPESVTNTVGAVMGAKPHINHAGYFSGNTGYLGVRRPYLIIERPNMCLPANYQKLNGYPSMITLTLGDCQGFTRVQQVQLTGMSATNSEQSEILELLKIGVVL